MQRTCDTSTVRIGCLFLFQKISRDALFYFWWEKTMKIRILAILFLSASVLNAQNYSLDYNSGTGALDLTKIGDNNATTVEIKSESGMLTGDRPAHFSGLFDVYTPNKAFKLDPAGFGSIAAFANLASGLSSHDLTVDGSLDGGGPLGEVAINGFGPSGPSPVDPPALLANGLLGQYWQLGEKEIITDANPMKTQAFDIMAASAPTGTFVATEFNYQGGNDLTPIGEWLQGDAGSLRGADPAANNFNDGFINFSGFLRVDEPGTVDFWIGSDDGSVLWVGDQIVVDNDGGHGAPGPAPNGSVTFDEAGYYPVSLNYFNGNWTNDAGDHGGANIAWRVGGEGGDIISSASLYHEVPEPAGFALLAAAISMIFIRMRRK